MKRLEKIFINSKDNLTDPRIRNKYIRKSGYIGVFANVLLFAIKLGVGLVVNSIAVISDAFNNLIDCLSSIVTIIGGYLAGKPADEEHPYGHGRYEYLSSLIVSILILITGGLLFKSSFEKILNPKPLNSSVLSLTLLVISLFIKYFLYIYNKVVGKKIKSLGMIGVAEDAVNDVISSVGILISLLVFILFGLNIDGYAGVIVSILIFKSGVEIFRESTFYILGKAAPEELQTKIKDILCQGKFVKGVHDLDLHDYGNGKIIGSVHVEFPNELIFKEVHDIADGLENKIFKETAVQLVIHMDPVKDNEY
ncbi:MAG: cation diffusion facilitator family transporter [Lagierella massiliensis]|nr:cation diffusion facilitator family transporter [Lagierella massiliensis]